MHLTDEAMDEWGSWLDEAEPPDENEVSEADYEERDRQVDIEQMNCGHENTSEEMAGYVNRNGSVELLYVCSDCGLERPTGRYTSIL